MHRLILLLLATSALRASAEDWPQFMSNAQHSGNAAGREINPDGSASDVRVMESSFKSSKVGDCVVRMVSGWTFTGLPKPLDTSHTYVLDRL